MRRNQMERVMNMLRNDRSVTADNFTNLLSVDFLRLLSDYFENAKDLQINVDKSGEKMRVVVSFCADNIKNFMSVPDVNLL